MGMCRLMSSAKRVTAPPWPRLVTGKISGEKEVTFGGMDIEDSDKTVHV